MAVHNIESFVNRNGTKGHSLNIVKGCNGPAGDGVHCKYCYACKMVKWLGFAEKVAIKEITFLLENKLIEQNYISDYKDKVLKLTEKIKAFKPHFFEYVYAQKLRKKPTMYFFSMSDPADWKPEWHERIVEKINQYPQHIFVILTKRPRVYEKYCFPMNCWCGITITNQKFLKKWSLCLESFRRNNFYYRKMFFSIEPIYSEIDLSLIKKIKPDWLIIGPETGTKKKTPGEWIEPFFDLDISVFMKNACSQLVTRPLRQEWPEGYLNVKT